MYTICTFCVYKNNNIRTLCLYLSYDVIPGISI